MVAADGAGAWIDGSKDYKLTVPVDVPAKQFWSAVVHDVETARMLQESSNQQGGSRIIYQRFGEESGRIG
jgi:hypothetical protein